MRTKYLSAHYPRLHEALAPYSHPMWGNLCVNRDVHSSNE
jgi:hypothetical protein